MRLALAQAERAQGISAPNPAVGCVLVDEAGRLIGEGFTQAVGQSHAEVMGLRDARERGHSCSGATAYVTLEPCAHQGRTGPCCDALIAAGVRRVVVALQDPNPRVSGQGLERLRAAGVQVEVGPGTTASRELNLGFFSRMERGRPWVRSKLACSLDGRTALMNGASQWITSAPAREDGHAWRARAGAVLTGVGTLLRDDPLLNVRLPQTPRQPLLAIIDSRLRTPQQARLWGVTGRPVLIYTAAASGLQHWMRERNAEVVTLPDANGGVDLRAVLRDLAVREINDVHVEAGATLNGALWRADLVDELLLYLAPKLLGSGAGLVNLGPLTDVAQAIELRWMSAERVGPDLRILARRTDAKP